jgi:hypothetical protein
VNSVNSKGMRKGILKNNYISQSEDMPGKIFVYAEKL